MFDGKKLRKLRKEIGLTQSDMAEKFNIKRETYTRYETGAITPPADMIANIAEFLGTTTDYLLGLSDDPQSPNINRPFTAADAMRMVKGEFSEKSAKELESFMELLRMRDRVEQMNSDLEYEKKEPGFQG